MHAHNAFFFLLFFLGFLSVPRKMESLSSGTVTPQIRSENRQTAVNEDRTLLKCISQFTPLIISRQCWYKKAVGIHRCMLSPCALPGWWHAPMLPLGTMWPVVAWTTSAPYTAWRPARAVCVSPGSYRVIQVGRTMLLHSCGRASESTPYKMIEGKKS